jgi:hypothetical protein
MKQLNFRKTFSSWQIWGWMRTDSQLHGLGFSQVCIYSFAALSYLAVTTKQVVTL